MFIVVGVWISPMAIVAVAIVAVVVFGAWWMLPVAAACAVLAVLAAARMARSAERRGQLATAHWPQQQLRAEALKRVAPPRRVTASGGVTIINNYFTDPPGVQMAPVIRSITGGEDGTVQQQQELVEHRTHRQLRLPPQPRLTGDHRPPREAGQEGGGDEGSA